MNWERQAQGPPRDGTAPESVDALYLRGREPEALAEFEGLAYTDKPKMDSHRVERRRQYCLRCNQLMFEYYRSPDGHFGLVETQGPVFSRPDERELRCPACQARYRLLDRLNAMGQPVERK